MDLAGASASRRARVLTGVPGLGKSQTQIHLIGCVSAGLAWPDGAKALPPANVIMLTAEDVLQDEVVPRLLAANANLDRVHILKKIRKDGRIVSFCSGKISTCWSGPSPISAK